MIRIKSTIEAGRTEPVKVYVCTFCGTKTKFYFTTPAACESCNKEIPDITAIHQSDEHRLQYHWDGKTLGERQYYNQREF